MKNAKKLFILFVMAIFAISALTGCANTGTSDTKQPVTAQTTTITVGAAASLQDAVKEAKEVYEAKHPDIKITCSFASSGTLQTQIEEGAPMDLFMSAGKKQMDALAEKSLIVESSRIDLLNNSLVLIAPKGSTLASMEGLKASQVQKVSLGTPETVPAGKYAKESLISLNLWDALQDKLVLAKDVRQVLTYVETGNVDAGLVYSSDTVGSEDIKIVTNIPDNAHQAIVYPLAIIKSSKNQQATQDFIDFLQSQEASDLFSKYGFKPMS